MTTRRTILRAAIAICLLGGAALQAEEAAPAAGAAAQGVLPEDIVAIVSTGAAETSIQNLEKFLVKAVEGSPFALLMQPGLLSMKLPDLTKFTLPAMNAKAAMHLVFCNPPEPGREPPVALLLPVPDFKNKLDALANMGMKATEEDGAWKVESPKAPPSYFVDAGNGYVATSDRPENARHVAASFAKNPPPPVMAGPNAPTFLVTVDVGKLLALNAARIDAAVKEAEGKIAEAEAEAKNAPPGLPPFAKNVLKLAPVYLKRLRALGESVESVRAYVYCDENALRVSKYVTPRAGTPLAAVAEAYAASKSTYETANYLPKNAAAVFCMNQRPALTPEVKAAILDMVQDFAGALDPATAPALRDVAAKIFELEFGETCGAVLPSDKPEMRIVQYAGMKNAGAYFGLMESVTAQTTGFVNALYKAMELPMALKTSFKKDAGTVADVPYATQTFAFEAVGVAPDDPMKAQAAQAANAMAKNMTQYSTILGDTLVTASASDGEKTLGEAIAALKDKKPGLGENASFTEAMNAAKEKQIGAASIYLLDFLKFSMAFGASMNPMGAPMAAAFKDLPSSAKPLHFSAGAAKGKVEGLGRENDCSLVFRMDLPAKCVAELIAASLQVQQKMMQFNVGNEGGDQPAPAPQPDEKAPVEAF